MFRFQSFDAESSNEIGLASAGFRRIIAMKKYFAVVAALFFSLPSGLFAQDSKFAADQLKYSRDFYGKVHFVAITNLSLGLAGKTEFKYDRYPDGGPERIQCPSGEFVRRKGEKNWIKSDDWGDTGTPIDATTAGRLNNWVGLIDGMIKSEPALRFVSKRDEGDRHEVVFEETSHSKGKPPQYVFGKYKNEKDDQMLFSNFSGPMKLGGHDATVDMSFSYLVSVNIQDVSGASPAPSFAPAEAQSPPANGTSIALLDGKFHIDVPSDFVREPNDPAKPKTLAKFSRSDGAWGTVLRGTHGLKPEELDGYLKKRVAEYNKGFNWLPKDAHLQWIHHELVTIDGRKWADWSFVPMMKGKKDYRNSPVYSRNLTTSYKDQLLEINFTTNLSTDPELKDEIDRIMSSVHLEE